MVCHQSRANFQLERDTPPSPPFVVSHFSVYMKLSMLNPTKAEGPDGIPAWLLNENADLLAKPITDILNCSYREGKLPLSWKNADIVPVPKQKPAKDVNKDLRPISLTPILSKVVEEFVIQEYVKPAIYRKLIVASMGLSLSHRRHRLSLVWCMRGQNIQTEMVLRLEWFSSTIRRHLISLIT